MNSYQVAMLVGSSLADREPEVLATVEGLDHRDAMRAFFASSLHPRVVTQRQIRAAMVGDHGTNQDSNFGLHYTVDGVEYVVTDMDIITTERRPAMHVMPDGELTENPDVFHIPESLPIEGASETVSCDVHGGEHVPHVGCVNANPTAQEAPVIHPDDEDREYELNRELDATEQRAINARSAEHVIGIIAGRLMPEPEPDGTESDDLYHIQAPPAGDQIIADTTLSDSEAFAAAKVAYAAEDHGPLAAKLSDRTLDKVLSRPAHVPSIVMLDRDAAAHRLADVVTDILRSPGLKERDPVAYEQTRQALADYRETCQ